jgi:hypothetical protein
MRHSAPAISVELTPDTLWRRVAWAMPLLAALIGTWWLVDQFGAGGPAGWSDPAHVVPVMLTLACWLLGVFAGWRLRHTAAQPGRPARHAVAHDTAQAAATLCWDGAGWQLGQGDGTDLRAVDLQIKLDLGGWMLLLARPATTHSGRTTRGDGRWLALARCDHAGAWHGLRCALYSPRPPQPSPHDR